MNGRKANLHLFHRNSPSPETGTAWSWREDSELMEEEVLRQKAGPCERLWQETEVSFAVFVSRAEMGLEGWRRKECSRPRAD